MIVNKITLIRMKKLAYKLKLKGCNGKNIKTY